MRKVVNERCWEWKRNKCNIKIQSSHIPNQYHVIDFKDNICSCGVHLTTKRPCYHMVWRSDNVEPLMNIHDFFPPEDKTDMWKSQYLGISFNEIQSYDLRTTDSNLSWKEPVAIRNPKGRPKNTREKESSV